MRQQLWIVALCLMAFAAVALADNGPSASRFDPSQVILAPGGRISHNLDDPQPDTLRYDDGVISGFYQTANAWGRVKFTAPNNFELRSVYFVTNNPNGNAAPCSVIVHAANGNNLGAVLARYRVTGVTHFGGSLSDPEWNDTNLPTPVNIDAGTDFYVVLGPQPGGTQAQGWHMLIDASPTPGRSGLATTHTGTYGNAQGDWLIRVGGAAEAFIDLSAEECYNTTAAGAPAFNMLPGTTFTLGGQVHNTGNQNVDLYTASWTVWGPGGTIVFTNEVTGAAIDAGTLAQVEADEDFTPMTAGEYMAAFVLDADNDAVAANDTSWLRMFVGQNHRWYRYDDNLEADGYTSFVPDAGWGVSFAPATYTAAVESLRVNVGGAGAGDVQIWLNDAEGLPDTVVWSDAPTLAQGWNTISVVPPVLLFSGQTFTVLYVYTSVSLGQDVNPPNAAAITHMGVTSFQYEQGEFSPDNSGNWCIQAYVDSSNELPPYPLIATNLDTLNFGQIDTTAHNTAAITLWVYNEGNRDSLRITSMTVQPASIRPAFTIVPNIFAVAAGDSQAVQITFDPYAIRSYNGLLAVNNNSNNMPVKNLIIRAEGVGAGATELPGATLPTSFALSQNFPNPFNPVTEIRFDLPMAAQARLAVYNVLGQEVALLVNEVLPAGTYQQSFDATNLPAGIYFYRLEAGSFSDIRKMMLIK